MLVNGSVLAASISANAVDYFGQLWYVGVPLAGLAFIVAVVGVIRGWFG